MELQECDFDVKHRPGSDHGKADVLSRLPNVQDGDPPTLRPADSSNYNCATTMKPGYNLQAKQMEDPALSKIIQLKLDGFPKPSRFVWGHGPVMRAYWNSWDSLHVVNGLLVKSTGNNSFPQYALLFPNASFSLFYRTFIVVHFLATSVSSKPLCALDIVSSRITWPLTLKSLYDA